MKNKGIKLLRQIKMLYLRLYRINDSPQKIALGFGIGVFLGVMPGLGILASILAAALFRVNKVSTVLGTLLTNTWLSFATFILSIKTGSAIMGLHWQDVYKQCMGIIRHFHWLDVFKVSLLKILLPVGIGFIVVSLGIALIAYVAAYWVITNYRNRKKEGKPHV